MKTNLDLIDLSTKLGKLKLINPTILASGILGTSKKILERISKNGAGAVTIKTLTLKAREGHKSPIIAEIKDGLINAVGYRNMGIDKGIVEFSNWNSKNSPLIVSITGKNVSEFEMLAEISIECEYSALEIALSCPHTPGFGTLAGQTKPEITYEITKAVKKKIGNIPLIVKLSPNSPALVESAKACEKGGADIINMGNSVGPGMKINIERKKPVLHFGFGGMSGPVIKPIAIRCVYDIYPNVKIPIIGTGGVSNGKDAIEMFMAGASAVGIGTAVHFRGIEVFNKITDEMKEWMSKSGYNNLSKLVGVAHEKK